MSAIGLRAERAELSAGVLAAFFFFFAALAVVASRSLRRERAR